MSWIKKHFDQATLALLALTLLAVSGLLIFKAQGFEEQFAAARVQPTPKTNAPPLDISAFEQAKEAIATPVKWQPKEALRFAFVPPVFIIDPTTKTPKKIGEGGLRQDSLSGQRIPNQWFLDNGLNPRDPNVANEDPDGDGFLNEDEWRETLTTGKSTDPKNKASHPAFITKLFFDHMGSRPFLLGFKAWDGDPKMPESVNIQINPLTKTGATQFVKISSMVVGTYFKVEKFDFKEIPDPNAGTKDVSEVTLLNTETNERVVLVKEKNVSSTDVSAFFDYEMPQAPKIPEVRRFREFELPPEPGKKYKLTDVTETQAVIQPPTGEPMIIAPDPRKKKK